MAEHAKSLASSAYDLASTVAAEVTGFAAVSESSNGHPASVNTATEQQDSSKQSSSNDQPTQQQEEHKSDLPAREDHSEEHERGPSHSDRPSKSQQVLGTETGIPTTAGAGTTVSPDDDVVEAAKREAQKKKDGRTPANVGVDYSDQPCPTGDSRRDQPTSEPAEGKTRFDSKEQQLNGISPESSKSSGGEESGKTDSTAATSTEGEQEAKAGWKAKLKGEAKVVAGKLTRNEEKVELGKSIKAGAAQA